MRWDVVVSVDANLYGTPNAEAPTDQPPQTFTLFETENLIGRGGPGIRVQVPVRTDVGVSRRQALLIRRPDGGLAVRELGSANGTQLNGVELVPGVETPVKDRDILAAVRVHHADRAAAGHSRPHRQRRPGLPQHRHVHADPHHLRMPAERHPPGRPIQA